MHTRQDINIFGTYGHKMLEQLKDGNLVITKDGQDAAVLLGMEDYEQLLAEALLKTLRTSEEQIKTGQGSPLDEAMREVRESVSDV